MLIPRRVAWLFWDANAAEIDVERHERAIIPRVLERGRLEDVRWLLGAYGRERIHAFLRDVGHTELSARTITFWRAAFDAKKERWADPKASRPLSAAPWLD